MSKIDELVERDAGLETSKEALEEFVRSGAAARQMRVVIELVMEHEGWTSLELGALGRLDRYQIARTLPQAERAGAIRRGDPRMCRIGNRRALTWWPVREQLRLDLDGGRHG